MLQEFSNISVVRYNNKYINFNYFIFFRSKNNSWQIKHQKQQKSYLSTPAVQLIEVTFWKGQLRRCALALDTFKICIENYIKIIPTWIPREHEFFAHYYSNNFDTDDWTIEQNSFETIYKKCGTVTFDRFANNLNKKVISILNRYYCPGTCSVICFSKNWLDSNLNWLCNQCICI